VKFCKYFCVFKMSVGNRCISTCSWCTHGGTRQLQPERVREAENVIFHNRFQNAQEEGDREVGRYASSIGLEEVLKGA